MILMAELISKNEFFCIIILQKREYCANIKTDLIKYSDEQDSNPWNLTGIRCHRLRASFEEWEIWEHLGADWLK